MTDTTIRAQATPPGDLVGQIKRLMQHTVKADIDRLKGRSCLGGMCDEGPCKCLDDLTAAALSAITAAGYEIRPRAAEKEAQAASHGPDDDYVDRFAVAMKMKLAKAWEKGRSGWQDMDAVTLSRMLWEHVEKGDPTDVANFCMFLWHHRAAIVPKAGYEIRPRVDDANAPSPAFAKPAVIADTIETLERENADLTRRLAEVTAARDKAENIAIDAVRGTIRRHKAVVETAEAALSRRDEALRVAREALEGVERASDRRSQLLVEIAELDNARRITRSAIAKIDALTKPQEAADAGENG